MGEDKENLGMDLFDLDVEDLVEGDDNPFLEGGTEGAGEGKTGEEPEDKTDGTPSEGDDSEKVASGKAGGDESGTEGGDNASPNLYKTLATVLSEEGVIPSVESTEIGKAESVEDLVGFIQKQVKENEFSGLNKLQKEYLDSLEKGLPTESFDNHKRAESQLEHITEEDINTNESLRKQLIFNDFKSRGYSDEKSGKLTERTFEADEDVEEAKIAFESLKQVVAERKATEIKNIKAINDAADKRIADDRKELKKLVFDTDEIIKGFGINEGLKKQIYSKIANPTSTNPDTGKQENALMKYQRENPKDFMHKLYYLFTVTKDFSDFEYFATKGKSSSVRDLEQAITSSTHVSSGGSPSFVDDPNSLSFDIGDELVLE